MIVGAMIVGVMFLRNLFTSLAHKINKQENIENHYLFFRVLFSILVCKFEIYYVGAFHNMRNHLLSVQKSWYKRFAKYLRFNCRFYCTRKCAKENCALQSFCSGFFRVYLRFLVIRSELVHSNTGDIFTVFEHEGIISIYFHKIGTRCSKNSNTSWRNPKSRWVQEPFNCRQRQIFRVNLTGILPLASAIYSIFFFIQRAQKKSPKNQIVVGKFVKIRWSERKHLRCL